MKHRLKSSIGLLIFITVFILNLSPLFAKTGDNNIIRVGLTKEYLNKPFIEISNHLIKMGFSKDNVYTVTNTINAKKGIRISAGFGERFSDEEFKTYSSAKKRAVRLSASDKLIVPALVKVDEDGNVWQLYRNTENAENIDSENSSKYLLSIKIGNNKFFVDSEKIGANPQFKAEGGVSLQKGRYRGRIEVGTYGRDAVTPVNVINIEDYVRGVVPMEMNYTWNEEALKAQAVCARGFATAESGFGSDGDIEKGYNLTNTSSHQSYGGMNVEKEETDKAVTDTNNEFVTYENQVVKTPYFSTSGGYTEDSENVWQKKLPWLRAVSDKYEDKPEKAPWTVGFTKEEVLNRIKRYKNIGTVSRIKITKKSKSGRALKLKIYGRNGRLTLKKNEIRNVFSLYSTMIEVYSKKNFPDTPDEDKKDKDFIFKGRGYGHGVGLSQSGARSMADAGYNYIEILEHYFTGIEVN